MASPYHLRHPDSTPSNPKTICGMEPDMIYVGENYFPKMTEWEWVKSYYRRGRCPSICDMCVAAQQAAEEHQENWKKAPAESEEPLPF